MIPYPPPNCCARIQGDPGKKVLHRHEQAAPAGCPRAHHCSPHTTAPPCSRRWWGHCTVLVTGKAWARHRLSLLAAGDPGAGHSSCHHAAPNSAWPALSTHQRALPQTHRSSQGAPGPHPDGAQLEVLARIVIDDGHKVIAQVALLVTALLVHVLGGHEGGNVEDSCKAERPAEPLRLGWGLRPGHLWVSRSPSLMPGPQHWLLLRAELLEAELPAPSQPQCPGW